MNDFSVTVEFWQRSDQNQYATLAKNKRRKSKRQNSNNQMLDEPLA